MESSDSDQAPVSSTLPEHVQPAARHDTSTDLEARLPNGHGGRVSHWQAIGRAVQKLLVQSPSPPFGIDPSLPKQSLLDQAGQLCFLCLEGKGNTHVAIRIPCLRSTGYRRPIKSTYKKPETKSGCLQLMEVEYARMHPSERVFEPYSTIFGRLVDKCFEYLGNWKRWLPFHGVTDVTEVEFTFIRPKDQNGTFAIHVSRMNREEIEKRVQHDLARGPGPPDSDEMCSVDKHVTDCLKEVVTGYLCPYERYETAKRQHKNLKLPGQLRDCARDTRLADELEIFNNMVLGSYIYDLHNDVWKANYVDIPKQGQVYEGIDEYNGLQFDLGWQTDRIMAETPMPLTWVWVTLSCIWLAVIACGRPTGKWELAMTMGSLLMSSCLLFLQYVGRP